MKLTNLTIKDLFTPDAKLTFLVGAGCSVDPPSCLPVGRKMIEEIVKYTCAESEIQKILDLEDLRFEQLTEIVRESLDEDLKIIDYYGQCDKPNLQHFFLADMIKSGYFVMTTNFDFLVEYALQQSGVPNEEILPIITKSDFQSHNNPQELLTRGMKTIYKVHGSTKNIISGENTKDYLVATLQAFGSNKEGENIFQVEPFKRPLFENISSGRSLVIMGYSGSDDFDIVPTLILLKNLKKIVWIDYRQEDGGFEKIYEINDSTLEDAKNSDKVNQILTKIYRMHNADYVYRVVVNTTRLIGELFDCKPNISSSNFSISPMTWFKNNLKLSDDFEKYFIPCKIYTDFDLIDDAINCLKIILEIAKQKNDKKWKSRAFNNIGFLLSYKGQFDLALKHYRKALEISEQLGDLKSKAIRLNNIGSILYSKGELNLALKHYREALEVNEELGNLQGKATDLSNIGLLLQVKGELNQALKLYREALEIDEQLGNLRGKATRLNNIGSLMKSKGELDEAIKHYRESLEIDEQLGNLRSKATDLNNIGSLLYGKGKVNEALNYYREALEIDDQLGNLEGKAMRLNNIGLILKGKGELEEALKYCQEALEINDKLGNLWGKATDLNNIGALLEDMGKVDGALEHYREALEIFKQLDSPKAEVVKENIDFLKSKMK